MKRLFVVLFVLVFLSACDASDTGVQGETGATPDEDSGKDSDVKTMRTLAYFREENLSRYEEYKKANAELSIEDIVTYINIGLDHEFYTETTEIADGDDPLVLVNKYRSLPMGYIPQNLTAIPAKYNSRNSKMRSEATTHFVEMCEALKADGIIITSGTAYRSYEYQMQLYDSYVARDGIEVAETYSARPGFSEHQSGLCVDLIDSAGANLSADSPAYIWLCQNAHLYGFIQRYEKGKEHITGYKSEEWHYRYVGATVAAELRDSGLTFDEYIARLDCALIE